MIEIEYVGTAPYVSRFAQLLGDEGLTASYESNLRESRGAGNVVEVGKVIFHVGLDGAKTLTEDMAKKASDLGEGAVITVLAQKAMKRFKDRVPKAHIEIVESQDE